MLHGGGNGNGNGATRGRPKRLTPAERRRAQRQRAADLLARFDRTPRAPADGDEARKLVALIRRGYLKRKGGAGYIRTAKVFHVDATR
jgi:hypothetical protein